MNEYNSRIKHCFYPIPVEQILNDQIAAIYYFSYIIIDYYYYIIVILLLLYYIILYYIIIISLYYYYYILFYYIILLLLLLLFIITYILLFLLFLQCIRHITAEITNYCSFSNKRIQIKLTKLIIQQTSIEEFCYMVTLNWENLNIDFKQNDSIKNQEYPFSTSINRWIQ